MMASRWREGWSRPASCAHTAIGPITSLGGAMAPRVERRLAAILAADVVGYSHLVEQDEAGTLSTLKDLRREIIDPLLAEYHGRVIKLMGDGAIAEFGSVVDAVACASAVQTSIARHQAEVPPERRIVL